MSQSIIIKPYSPIPRAARETSTECGSPVIIRADLSIDESGRKIAKLGQTLDLDAMIQAALPSTDIHAILAKAAMGDDSVLNVAPGFVGDTVALPKDLYDYKRMNDLYDKVSNSFNTLPDDLKALFGNNANEYLNSIISNKAEKIIADFKAIQNENKEDNKDA